MSNEICPDLRQAIGLRGRTWPANSGNDSGKLAAGTAAFLPHLTGCSIGGDCAVAKIVGSGGEIRTKAGCCRHVGEALNGIKAAELADVKVIIQNPETRRYLSANGRWVATEDDARDFVSLLPAYHFARNHTSGRFRVMLYCDEDNYRTTIAEGTGTGVDRFEGAPAYLPAAPVKANDVNRDQAKQSSQWLRLFTGLAGVGSHLN
jgi:hypothetical protein